MTTPTEGPRHDTDSIIEAARLGVELTDLHLGEVYAAPQADGSVKVIDLATTEHLNRLDAIAKRKGLAPERKTGHAQVADTRSFGMYVNDHQISGQTTLWGDRQQGRILAVFNGHGVSAEGMPDWGDHRATLTMQKTAEWVDWNNASGPVWSQEAFAEFLEGHLAEIVEPDGAQLLEVATSLQAHIGATMKSAIRLDSGQVQVAYEETIEASAGKAGKLTIPTRLTLALTPFEGGEPYKVEARFRYRLANGTLKLGVILDRPDDILRAAFADVVKKVEDDTSITVFYGTPPAA